MRNLKDQQLSNTDNKFEDVSYFKVFTILF